MEAAEEEGKWLLRRRQWRPGALPAERRDGGAEERLHHPLLAQPKQLLHAATGAQRKRKSKRKEREKGGTINNNPEGVEDGNPLLLVLSICPQRQEMGLIPCCSLSLSRFLSPVILQVLVFSARSVSVCNV